jgi:undecaprenyl-diphosphatase
MFRAIVLGITQGVSEFLPISSSAHLVLVPYVLTWDVNHPIPGTPALGFDVALHLGTLLAVLVYFRKDLWAILTGSLRAARGGRAEDDVVNARMLGLLVVATIPAAVVGFLLKDRIEDAFGEPQVVAALLLGTAALLFLADWLHDRREHHRDIASVGLVDALVIGGMQAVAILPGISRSGSTITAGIARGLSRESAARFSFLMSIPAILGAAVVALPDLKDIPSWGPVIVGAIAAAIVGFISIAFLLRFVRTNRLRPFAIYCIVASMAGLYFWLQVK